VITKQGQVQRIKPFLTESQRRSQRNLLGIIGLTAFLVAIGIFWISNSEQADLFFEWLSLFQQQAAEDLKAPDERSVWLLALGLLLSTQVVMRVSPKPKDWSRFLIITILLVLTARYVLWRSVATLNLSTPMNGAFSLGLYVIEVLAISNAAIRLFLMLREKDRHYEAELYSLSVESGSYLPSVDIFIPTYSEPPVVLRRTIVGCQAIDYSRKKVYLLDDGKRPEIKALAAELGCCYITRPDNRHAKAGNLNHAIDKTNGDLIVVFDADFVPTRNFLIRTVGFFQNKTIGLVQTHQCFYNADSFARNLGLDKEMPHENEAFGRHYLLIRDGSNSSLCYGSSFVMRRSALQDVGGFVTHSVSEDLFTGIQLAAKGHQVIYLDENLSAGLVPEDMPSQVIQRQRWARGSMQAFFLKENPLTIPGFNLRQRLAYFEGIFQWFNSPFRIGFLVVPIVASFLEIVPFSTTILDWAYFFLPLYLIQTSTFAWLNHRASSAIVADVYSVMNCFPVSATVLQTLVRPFSKGFRVTPKGTINTKVTFHWNLAMPLIVLLMLTACSLIWQAIVLAFHLKLSENPRTEDFFKLGLIWGSYNMLVLGAAILSYVDIPKPNLYEWFEQRRPVQLKVADQVINAVTTRLSEVGAEIKLFDSEMPALPKEDHLVRLYIFDDSGEKLALSATVTDTCCHSKLPRLKLAFEQVTPKQHRQLIEWLFCNPGQWPRQAAPGELRTAWLLIRALIRPRFLSKRVSVTTGVAFADGPVHLRA